MKNRFILFALIATAHLSAQVHKTEFGAEMGPGLSTMRGNAQLDMSKIPAPAFTGGVFFEYHFTDHFSLRTGLGIERKAGTTTGSVTDATGLHIGEFRYRIDLDYLNMPLLLRYSTGKKTKLFVNAGPYAAYLIQATSSIRHPFIDGAQVERGQERFYNQLDAGVSGGLGVSVPVDAFKLSAEIRHNYGLYNVSAVPVYRDGKIKTNVTLLIIGCSYRFS